MRVLQIHNYYRTYGGECRVVDTERALLESQSHEVHQFVCKSRNIAALHFIQKLALLVRIPHNRIIATRLTRILQQLKPDVAHVHNIFPLLSPSVFEALTKAGVPTVQTHHNYRMLCPNGLFYIAGQTCTRCRRGFHHAILRKCVRQSRLLSLLYALALQRARHCGLYAANISIHIALNRFFARQLIRAGIAADRIRICGNFVNGFAEPVEHKEEYFLYLGRLSPEKGLVTLVEAVRLAGVRLKIAGTGPIADMLKARTARFHSGQVEFLGLVGGRRKHDLIRKSIAAVVPSEWYETFGLAAAEALACGTPVIASRIGGLPEVVQDGVSGFLFKAGDAGDLANRLRQAWHNRRLTRRMGIQALAQAKKQFSSQVHARQLVNIYTEAIERFHAVAPHDL